MRYNIPYKARLLFKYKLVYPDHALIAMKAWAVPISPRTPEGVKYSMVYIDSAGKRVLGFDNAEGKGHHIHRDEIEMPFKFQSVNDLLKRFLAEVAAMRSQP